MGEDNKYPLKRATGGLVALLAFAGLVASPAQAQFTGSYTNTDPGAFSTACGAATVREIVVTDNVTITDVDFGFIADHNNRGELIMALRSPSGTQSTLINQGGGTLDDYNVRLDDAQAVVVNTGAQNVNNNVGAAPYQFTVRSQTAGSLAAFNGENAQGTWLMLACDVNANGVEGNHLRSELFISGTQNFADLSLTMTPDTFSPAYGSNVVMTLQVSHQSGDLTSTGVQVTYQLPSGLNFQSSNDPGNYNSTTGVWTVGNLAPGASRTIEITAEVLSTGSHASLAEITTQPVVDPDSTPNNAGFDPSEDDTAGANLSPGSLGGGPGTPPPLSCAAPGIFDWDTNAWAYDFVTLSRSYPTGGSDNTPFTFTFTGDTNRRDQNPSQATPDNPSPETNTDFSGGLSPAENSLFYWQNLNANTESITLTMNVGTTGTGVQDLQFDIFDIDFAAGQFRDRITVTGSLNGVAVSPVLTPGDANSVAGNTVSGTSSSGELEDRGNMSVTFLSPVDRVTVTYGNTVAGTGTSNQAMSVHDISYCPRQTDFGDAAATYLAASHLVVSGYMIGATAPDGETANQPSAAADGDDAAGADDEDPIDFSTLSAGAVTSFPVSVTGSGGRLQAWIDWNGDGDFDDTVDGINERVATNLTLAGTAGTINVPVTVPPSATATPTIARLRWSTVAGLGVSGSAINGEVEDHQLTILGAAQLDGAKTTTVYDPAGAGLFALPGNDVIYTITVSNAGGSATDTDSVVLIDQLPPEIEFWNGDINAGGGALPGSDPVSFDQSAGMTFTYGTDVRFSTAATKPVDYAACSTIAPDNTYRGDFNFICFNPKGALAAGDPDPEFSVSFRARIK